MMQNSRSRVNFLISPIVNTFFTTRVQRINKCAGWRDMRAASMLDRGEHDTPPIPYPVAHRRRRGDPGAAGTVAGPVASGCPSGVSLATNRHHPTVCEFYTCDCGRRAAHGCRGAKAGAVMRLARLRGRSPSRPRSSSAALRPRSQVAGRRPQTPGPPHVEFTDRGRHPCHTAVRPCTLWIRCSVERCRPVLPPPTLRMDWGRVLDDRAGSDR